MPISMEHTILYSLAYHAVLEVRTPTDSTVNVGVNLAIIWNNVRVFTSEQSVHHFVGPSCCRGMPPTLEGSLLHGDFLGAFLSLGISAHTQKNDLLASIPRLSSLGKAYNGQGRQASLPHAGSLLPSLEDLTKANGTPAASLDEAIQKGQLINLNTKEFKYTSYFLGIKSAVEADMSYPEDMALQGIAGGGLVAFAVERDGTVSEARIVRSSGHPSFDHEIVRAIRMASPLNPIPKRLEKDRLFLIWPFEFILDRFFS